MDMIIQKNNLDIQLYDFAIKLFEKRLALLRSSSEADNFKPKAVFFYRTNSTSKENLNSSANLPEINLSSSSIEDWESQGMMSNESYEKP